MTTLQKHVREVMKVVVPGEKLLPEKYIRVLREGERQHNEHDGNFHIAENIVSSDSRIEELSRRMNNTTLSIQQILEGRKIPLSPLTTKGEAENLAVHLIEEAIAKYLQDTPEAVEELMADIDRGKIRIEKEDADLAKRAADEKGKLASVAIADAFWEDDVFDPISHAILKGKDVVQFASAIPPAHRIPSTETPKNS